MSWIEYKQNYDIGGQKIEVTRKDFNGYRAIYEILGKNNDGDILLNMLEEHKPNEKPFIYDPGIRRVIVEQGWFTKEPKRIIKFI